jgi:formylglycine-generating enzyme required for sulfatase activity
VTFEAAQKYCESFKARLPTAAEWDAAVKGPSGWKYPWGNAWPTGPDARDIAVGLGPGSSPMKVETNNFDRGAYGQWDLAGNVQEWTSTDSPNGGGRKMLRGGDVADDKSAFEEPGDLFAGAAAATVAEGAKSGAEVGFRCAKDK